MNIAAHITFFYAENRIKYLEETIKNLQTINGTIEINIYCNEIFDTTIFGSKVFLKHYRYKKDGSKKYNKLKSKLSNFLKIPHNIHPYYLAWECRSEIEKTVNNFDVQIYIEDDITFNNLNFNYWLQYKNIFLANNYNLGFLRYEIDEEKRIFATDLLETINNTVLVNEIPGVVNNNNPYCGFWIYDKNELKKFIKSPEWNFKFKDYMIREKSAIGMHGTNMKFYRHSIPLIKNENNHLQIHKGCLVHHLPNNYIGNHEFCQVQLPLIF